mmetsp:Transcript_17273/g.61414  ORF Transcript_17273/g.61414 Transcript_17273/m.61414 type:complete len:397 (-) Transcript_17273:2242-3432(-)
MRRRRRARRPHRVALQKRRRRVHLGLFDHHAADGPAQPGRERGEEDDQRRLSPEQPRHFQRRRHARRLPRRHLRANQVDAHHFSRRRQAAPVCGTAAARVSSCDFRLRRRQPHAEEGRGLPPRARGHGARIRVTFKAGPAGRGRRARRAGVCADGRGERGRGAQNVRSRLGTGPLGVLARVRVDAPAGQGRRPAERRGRGGEHCCRVRFRRAENLRHCSRGFAHGRGARRYCQRSGFVYELVQAGAAVAGAKTRGLHRRFTFPREARRLRRGPGRFLARRAASRVARLAFTPGGARAPDGRRVFRPGGRHVARSGARVCHRQVSRRGGRARFTFVLQADRVAARLYLCEEHGSFSPGRRTLCDPFMCRLPRRALDGRRSGGPDDDGLWHRAHDDAP